MKNNDAVEPFDDLDAISEETREELGRILGVDPVLLSEEIPPGRELEWYNASDDRYEARMYCKYVEDKIERRKKKQS